MRSQGQKWAVGQLAELVEASDGAFELFDVADPADAGHDLTVVVTIDCSGFEHREGGVRFKARERIRVDIPADFPLSTPRAYFTHKRYAECPHVQWGKYI
jgi:hypothetical protein